ncbi:MAG: hypothetical protein Q3M24_17440 [Candidatus Electrothrix aestuarii]|uniref:Uncharacterized protein n=1 Tax=Candidatus Electrothrix aestuarii TaxID=3062594 RepID=A0AAU8LRC9_9BACT|nr:hypothetical protein [Candidatus Electrothrix aestuarii]WPD21409.1 MAG: hypothetical protein SD837_14510 [Candidatus Electrothrix sp. GW3-3]
MLNLKRKSIKPRGESATSFHCNMEVFALVMSAMSLLLFFTALLFFLTGDENIYLFDI